MPTLSVRTVSGSDMTIDQAALDRLAGRLDGDLLAPGVPAYDEARTIWNAMIDRRPGCIARCASARDVAHAVSFARDHELLVAVRGGGHNIAGLAVCDGGLMIDLSPMKAVQVDAPNRRVRVEPGVTLGELDSATQKFGLATPVGINSTTGIAGLTLGGGFGWLSRKYGLTVDSLVSADVVIASGELVKASQQENPDLFWAIRGGGGNFGVVTSFEFELHQVGPELLAGLVVHPFKDARAVLKHWRGCAAEAPDELACWPVLRKAPPLPFLPESVHGKEVVVLAMCHAGKIEEGQRATRPLRGFGTPIADVVGPHQFVAFQQAFDPLLTPGARNYWKSHDLSTISDGLIDTCIDFAGRLPNPQCEIFIAHLGGAITRAPADATSYPHRDAEFVMNVHTRWDDPAQDDECTTWARRFFETTAPYATGGVYVNFMSEDETDRVRAAYGASYDRLATIKRSYDPSNLFRLNQNIPPAGS
jgi:FAD/FMN-containing dehydrogenase